MAKRFTDTELWDREWFMNLNPTLKCLVKFVRDKADLCGVWSPNWIIANTYIGDKVNEEMLLKIDDGKQFVKIENGKIFCLGFIKFQYGTLSEKSPVHRKIISLLEQNKILENYQNIGYQHPINRVQEEDKEKEEEMDKEKETEEEKECVPKKEKKPTPQNVLFKDSEYYNLEVLTDALNKAKAPYCEANAGYYYEAMELWSRENNKRKIDWLATCQNWILKDFKDNKLITKNYSPEKNGSKQSNNEILRQQILSGTF